MTSFHYPHSHRHQAGCPSGNNTNRISLPLTQASLTYKLYILISREAHLMQSEGDVSQGWQSFTFFILTDFIHFVCVHPVGWAGWGVWCGPGQCRVFHHYGWVAVSPLCQVGLWILDQHYFLKQPHITFQDSAYFSKYLWLLQKWMQNEVQKGIFHL